MSTLESSSSGAASFERLRAYLEKRAPFTKDELGFLEPLFVPRTLRKSEFLQRVGEKARYSAFVAKGCLRSYVIDDRGKERILQFAPEDWWLADGISLLSGSPATFFIERRARIRLGICNRGLAKECPEVFQEVGVRWAAGTENSA